MRADYRLAGIHRAELPCLSCCGDGTVLGATCALCKGAKTYTVGCAQAGGALNVMIDLNHPTMAECVTCGRFIPPEEVTAR